MDWMLNVAECQWSLESNILHNKLNGQCNHPGLPDTKHSGGLSKMMKIWCSKKKEKKVLACKTSTYVNSVG